jgi:phospholipase/carboxylesterase
MDTLALRVAHRRVEPVEFEVPTGHVQLERGGSSAVLLTPEEIDPQRRYPMLTLLHGAGRHDEHLVKACRGLAEEHQVLMLVPRSLQPTWDLIVRDGTRPDADFLEYALDLIYRRYPVAERQQALLGFSDGASYGLSLGLSNPGLFEAVMAWAAGFVAVDSQIVSEQDPKLRIYLEYGTHDQLFPFEQVALPMRQSLEASGHDVTFSVDEGGRHWPSGTFVNEALAWWLAGLPE